MLLECLSLPLHSTYIVCGTEKWLHTCNGNECIVYEGYSIKSFYPICTTLVQLKRTEAHCLNDECISEIALLTAFYN